MIKLMSLELGVFASFPLAARNNGSNGCSSSSTLAQPCGSATSPIGVSCGWTRHEHGAWQLYRIFVSISSKTRDRSPVLFNKQPKFLSITYSIRLTAKMSRRYDSRVRHGFRNHQQYINKRLSRQLSSLRKDDCTKSSML